MKSSFLLLLLIMMETKMLEAEPSGIQWQPWSDTIFKKAQAEHKLVLLDLGAGWCHWCHVMDETTYSDPDVIALLSQKYIAVKVDQDSRPDLANRYEDYGWPATVVFKWDGSELAKRQGYIPPKPMASMLQAFIDDSTPGPSIRSETPVVSATESALATEQRVAMRLAFISAYDRVQGGWGEGHKYLNWDALEYCITEGTAGDAAMDRMARQTLAQGEKLIDPVWGGIYQYSTDGDWEHPHFEKIIPFQAENLRVFSIAASQWHEEKWLEDARKIRGFLQQFMTSPEGAFYTSQDADLRLGEHSSSYFSLNDEGRRQLGIPRVDTHLYARENGVVIVGLTSLYAASGDESCLLDAEKSARWAITHRSMEGGGFRHDEKDAAGPYLADTLAMARAFLALYTVTAEREWLRKAQDAAAFMDSHFSNPAGYLSAVPSGSLSLPPTQQVDENISMVRFANLLYAHTGDNKFRAMAEHAMKYLASPSVVDRQGFSVSGILLADREIQSDPPHVTIVGKKDDPSARALFMTALKESSPMSRIEWLDAREEKPPREDVDYPPSEVPQAFVCKKGICSIPLQTPEQLRLRITPLVKE